MKTEMVYLNPNEITSDPYQPRIKMFGIEKLVDSIQKDGQQVPIHIDMNNVLIDGERRWTAVQLVGCPLSAIKHPDISTLEQRDELRDVLRTQEDELPTVDRAWHYARRIIKINTGEDYTPQELMKMKEKNYGVLSDLIEPKKYDKRGRVLGQGTKELARQLSERSGDEYKQNTIYTHSMIIFVNNKILEKINDGEFSLYYGVYIARLYKNPDTMKKLEDEVLNGEFTTADDVGKRANEYLASIKKEGKKEAKKIPKPKNPKPKKPIQTKAKAADTDVNKEAKKEAAKPLPLTPIQKAQKKLLKEFGGGTCAERQIEIAKGEGVDQKIINEFSNTLKMLIQLIEIDPKKALEEGAVLNSKIKTTRDEIKHVNAMKKLKEAEKKKLKEEAKKELKDDPVFRQGAAKEVVAEENRKKKKEKRVPLAINTLNELNASEWVKFTKTWYIHDGDPSDLKELASVDADIEQHPATFSQIMVSEYVRFFSQREEVVLDPFVGIGSTLVACSRSGRKGIGIDINPDYCRIARKWVQDDPNQKVVLGDSWKIEELNIPNDITYTITSPPYYNMLQKQDADAKLRIDQGLATDYGTEIIYPESVEQYIDWLVDLFSKVGQKTIDGGHCTVILQNYRHKEMMIPLAFLFTLKMIERGDWILKGIRIWCQSQKTLHPYGYPVDFVPNVHHHYCIIFKKRGS